MPALTPLSQIPFDFGIAGIVLTVGRQTEPPGRWFASGLFTFEHFPRRSSANGDWTSVTMAGHDSVLPLLVFVRPERLFPFRSLADLPLIIERYLDPVLSAPGWADGLALT